MTNVLYATTSGFGAPMVNLLRMAHLATIIGTVALVGPEFGIRILRQRGAAER